MKEGNNKKDEFKRTLSIVTKTISKNKKIEVNFANNDLLLNKLILNPLWSDKSLKALI